MKRITALCLPLLAAALLVSAAFAILPARSATPEFTLLLEGPLVTGLDHPVQVTHAGDGSQRLFVVEQPGEIRVIQNGVLLATPFLDIRSLVKYGGEQGLLGLAFHPNYAANGYFFINYTNTAGDTIVARYHVSANPNVANPASALTILFVDQPYSNHNGGQLAFGPDGYLYIGMGDGGSGGDPQNYAQNLNSLLGKMLRLDIDHASPGKNYAIPPGNPYLGKTGLDEIWALGLRNPWRFSFDQQNGDLYLGDVGQNKWEEISFQKGGTAGGVNFGWRCLEGAHTYNTSPPCNSSSFLSTLTGPIAEYEHIALEGYSVTGGYVYRGSQFLNMVGVYFFGDYVTGRIWSMKQTTRDPLSWSARQLELVAGFNISGFGEGEDGELYVCDYGGGRILHLADASGAMDLSGSTKSANTAWANAGETVTYTIQLINHGGYVPGAYLLTDTLPANLTLVSDTLTATHGAILDDQPPVIAWSGVLSQGITVTIRYRASVNPLAEGSLNNIAYLSMNDQPLLTLPHSLFTPRPVLTTTHADFVLPGTQPGTLNAPLVDSVDCDTCHSAPIYDRWRGSMMSQAGRDPVMWAALAVANNVAPGAGEYCLRCHTPNGWFAGRSQDPHGGDLLAADIRNGVSCQTCHRMVDPLPPEPGETDELTSLDNSLRNVISPTLATMELGSGKMLLDPNDNRRGPFSFGGALPYHTAFQTDFLGQGGDPLAEARLCGVCHNVDNPVLSWDAGRNQYWPNTSGQPAPSFASGDLFPIERTYDEWALSKYAQTGVVAPQFAGAKPDQTVRTCQDCHMPRSQGTAADPAFNPVSRDCSAQNCLPEHDLVGANAWVPALLQSPEWRLRASGESSYLSAAIDLSEAFLKKAATLEAHLQDGVSQKTATITVTNQTGHKLPTGYPEGRRIWLNLQAFDASGALLYESGAYNLATGELTEDADIQVYEIKQGLTPELAYELGMNPGETFHFVLNNTTLKDNRIPPRGFTNDNYDVVGLRPVGAIYADQQYWDVVTYTLPADTSRIRAILYYQVASGEYIDFLKQYGGLDGEALYGMWTDSKSPPQVIQTAWYPNYPTFFPLIKR